MSFGRIKSGMLWVELYPRHSYVEALTENMTMFGDEVFKEVVNIK